MNNFNITSSIATATAILEPLPEDNQLESTSRRYTVNSLENNSNTDQLQKNLAARKIQCFFKKFLAAKAYKHMFDNGEYFTQYKEISSEPKSPLDYLTIAQKLSDKAINEIKNHLGDLNDQEKDFIQKIINLPKITLMHKTVYNLDHLNSAQKPTLTINSNRWLTESGVIFKGLTKREDIETLNNNDFVFTSVDLKGDDLDIKPNSIQTGDNVDYGNQAYLTYKKSEMFGYLTVTDQYHGRIEPTYRRNAYCRPFPGLRRIIYKEIHGSLGLNDTPIFTEKDMLLGIAYHAINIIRKAKCDTLNQFIYGDDISLVQINEFFNIIFTLEFHIPRILSTTDFKLHQLRKITTKEFYKLVILHQQVDMIRQYFLSKYSTEDELINITTRKDIAYIRNVLKEMNVFIEEAISDANAEVLSCCIYWYEKIINAGYDDRISSSIDEHKAALSILQRNTDEILEYASNLKSKIRLFYRLQNLLLKTKDFNDEIYLFLSNISKRCSHFEFKTLMELYVMIDKIEYIPDNIMKSLSICDISNKLVDYEYKNVSLEYAKLAAKFIMQDKSNAKNLTYSSTFAGTQHLPKSRLKIQEDDFLSILYHPDMTPEVRDILQRALIDSEVLNPDKKINDSKDRTLRDYAKEHYNINL